MAEPKKETVKIVLPPRSSSTPIASNPRETAMINLPPKPMPVPPSGLKAPSVAPAIPKPASMPSAPKSVPPAPPVSSGAVKPPTTFPAPPAASITPIDPKRSSPASTPSKPILPAPLQTSMKRETGKIPASMAAPKATPPQASVHIAREVAPKSSSINVIRGESQAVVNSPASNNAGILGIAALVLAVLSLGVQLWITLL